MGPRVHRQQDGLSLQQDTVLCPRPREKHPDRLVGRARRGGRRLEQVQTVALPAAVGRGAITERDGRYFVPDGEACAARLCRRIPTLPHGKDAPRNF